MRRDDERQLHGPHREAQELMKGPTIRRGARVGGGAVLAPAIEIGEEAFVGAGAVVTKDVPPRDARRRQPGARPARRRRGRAQGERRRPRARACTCTGSRRPRARTSPRGSTCRPARAECRAAPGAPAGCEPREPDALARRGRRRARVPGAQSCSRTFAAVEGDRRAKSRCPAHEPDAVDVEVVVPVVERRVDRARRRRSVCAHGAGVVVRLVRGRAAAAAASMLSRVERARDVERPPARQRVAPGRRTRRSRRASTRRRRSAR